MCSLIVTVYEKSHNAAFQSHCTNRIFEFPSCENRSNNVPTWRSQDALASSISTTGNKMASGRLIARLVVIPVGFNTIVIQGTPQMAADKEAISLSRVHSYYPKCNLLRIARIYCNYKYNSELLAKQLYRKSSLAHSMERCITDGMQQYSER